MQREINLSLDSSDDTQESSLTNKADQNSLQLDSVHTGIRLVNEVSPSTDIVLTADEQEQVDKFSKTIDLYDTQAILNYGSTAQTHISQFSDKALAAVKTKDLGEVGNLLSEVVLELKNFDFEEKKGVLGFLKRSKDKALALKTRYDSAEKNIEKISATLDLHQRELMKDLFKLDEMYELNESYFKELSMYILAGKQFVETHAQEQLSQLESFAQQSKSPHDIQKLNDFHASLSRFEKKLHDLELTRMVSLQMAPQIRMIQASNSVMIEKIQSTIVNTIPLWKTQMSLALSVLHTAQAAQAQSEVTDLTNELLRKNAEQLKGATVATARSAERSIVDIETLRHSNEELISALSEVRDIQIEGQRKRSEASAELARIEQELKQSLIALVQQK